MLAWCSSLSDVAAVSALHGRSEKELKEAGQLLGSLAAKGIWGNKTDQAGVGIGVQDLGFWV